ncbi:MAG: hypothetical protein LAN36_08550 [Acidobacteriia bacterium]|nr:hypothetical protein [Terriglobia bacterium]
MTIRSILALFICCLMLAARPVAALAGGQTQNAPASGATHGASDVKESTGIVTESVCSGANQRIELKTSSGVLHLRGPAGGGLAIVETSQLPVGFNSCTSLKGLRVSVQYKPDIAQKQSGTVQSLRLLPPEDSDPGAGPQAPPPSSGDSATQLVPDAAMTAEGRVTDVKCTGNEILVKIVTPARPFALHARDYARLTYDDDRTSFENRDFPACTQLNGRVAAIQFIVVEHKQWDGEMQSVEIEK